MRPRLIFILALAACLLPVARASAAYTAGGTGKGYAGARALATVVTPTATVSGRNVTLSWENPGGNVPVSGYTVKRYSTGGAAQTLKTACTGTITGLTCTENAVPAGSWRYSVTPIVGTNWKGAESVQSTAITVAAPTVTVTPTTVTALPQSFSGSVDNFISGQSVSFRLDSTTGTILSGAITPSAVPASGTSSLSVTLPSGVANGSHRIYAIGSGGDSVYATVTVSVPRTLSTTAWDVRDASSGTEINVSDRFAAADGLTATTSSYNAAFAADRYDEADFNAPLRPGVAVSAANFNLRIAAPSSGQTACFYVEIRKQSDPSTLLETEGSAASPTCVTGTTQTTTALPLSSVTTTDIANDLAARIYGRVSGGGAFVVDQANITGTSSDGAFTLNQEHSGGNNFGTSFDSIWSLLDQDAFAITTATAFPTTYATTRYIKYTFPSGYVPSGATGISATLIHAYRGSAGGVCTYMQIYNGATSIATKGSSTSNLSCATSTTTDQVDTVSIPEINTVAEGNAVVVRVYAKASGTATPLVADQVKLQLTYVK